MSGRMPNFLTNRLLQMSQPYVMADNIGSRLSNTMTSSIIYHCQGNWGKIDGLDEDLINASLKIGEFYQVSIYLYWFGFVKIEQGDFGPCERVIDKSLEIGETFDNKHAISVARLLKTEYLIKVGSAQKAQLESESVTSNPRKVFSGYAIMFWGLRAESQQLLGDMEGASYSISQGSQIYKRRRFIPPYWLAHFMATCFSIEIEQLKQAMQSDDGQEVAQLSKHTYRSGKLALHNSLRYAPYRTKIFRLMGEYYWQTGKQGKALKWWKKAIREGERLGARPDLSRTYFEVGKRLMETHSKNKKLNGIDAKGYLKKAGNLFEEMGLNRDLEELKAIRSSA
jgi:hypothetical protein